MIQHAKVKIIGDHPWVGEYGKIEMRSWKIEVIYPTGPDKPMVKVILDNNKECYAKRENLDFIEIPKEALG